MRSSVALAIIGFIVVASSEGPSAYHFTGGLLRPRVNRDLWPRVVFRQHIGKRRQPAVFVLRATTL